MDLASLDSVGIGALRELWRGLRGSEPPDFRTSKLRRAVAYALQAEQQGDLSPRELAELRQAGRKNASVSRRRAPAAGTKLLRSWGGQVHEVLVVDEGYLWKSEQWTSLSRIAQEITGTKWNGPDFFGLRAKPATAGKHTHAA